MCSVTVYSVLYVTDPLCAVGLFALCCGVVRRSSLWGGVLYDPIVSLCDKQCQTIVRASLSCTAVLSLCF